MFKSLARFCYHHRWYVVSGWVALLIGFFALSSAFGGAFRTEFSLPGSETQAAGDILRDNGFGDRAGSQAQVVFEAQQGVDDPAVQQTMDGLFSKISGELTDATLISPYQPEGANQVAPGGKIAYAQINFSERAQEDYVTQGDLIKHDAAAVSLPGLQVELGGDMFAAQSMPASEVIGVAAAIIILLVAFGSLLAMGVPIITALFGVGCGVALVGLTTRILAVPAFATPTAAMLGIGVGIDYALLIVTRYRQGLRDGLDPEEAVVLAMNTAGRSVLFAGITVVIAVLGMFVMNLDLIRAVALGAALAVLMTMLASITLLPALLAIAGRWIDRFGLPHKATAEGPAKQSFWHRWSRVIQSHPWPAALGSVALLLILAVPTLSLRLGFGDAGNRPTTDTSRRAYDILSTGFGPGFNGPFVLAARTPDKADFAVLQKLSDTLNHTDGVAFASQPIPSPTGQAALISLIPTTSPQDAKTTALVHRLRDDVIPTAVAGTSTVVKVGGVSAASQDFAAYTGERMPYFFAAVLALSFILLMVVFRSILVPLKAVIVNLLSIGVAFGAMVAVFQWGWGASLLGIGKEGPIEAWAPMMLFAIVFGLSMDYEVFLLSRIREEYDKTHDNASAVADGLASTARVITAAAAIMVCVFSSFILGDDRSLKLFGFGLAVAVFIDATVVRLVLVPATMELLGDGNWWIPGWLNRALPSIHIEGDAADLAPGERAASGS